MIVCKKYFINMYPADLYFQVFDFIDAFPTVKRSFHAYKDMLVKCHRSKQCLQFLKDCRANCIIPKSMLPMRFRSSVMKPFSDASSEILNETIDQVKMDINFKFHLSRNLHSKLVQCFNNLPGHVNICNFYNLVEYSHRIANNESQKTKK